MDDETKRKAFALRQQGKSWEEISTILHYDRTVLSRAVVETAKNCKRRPKA